MICTFQLYPDELLYSACARYGASMQYPNKTQAIHDYFGIGAYAILDLPGRLNHLLHSLPSGHLYTADELINKHTNFPFYVPFLPKGGARMVRELMFSDNSRLVSQIRRTCHGKKITRLRFCPECVSEDRVAFGETYWHRAHHLHGVNACLRHELFLEDSEVQWHSQVGVQPADLFVKVISSRKLVHSNSLHLIHLKLSQIASFLLENVRDSLDCEVLAHRYRNVLLQLGFGHYNGQVRITKLVSKIKEYYPGDFLAQLGCTIQGERGWINRLVSMRQAEEKQHPICHLLMLTFLDCDSKEFFDGFVEYMPFGEGPWPCLNPIMSHYQQAQISSCIVVPGTKKDLGNPRGIFKCSCGFNYARTGPDISVADRFTYTIVQAHGALWEARLRELWVDQSYDLKAIATALGVSATTLKRRVVALGLRFRRFKHGVAGKKGVPDRYRLRRVSKNALLEKKRQELLNLLAEHPKASRLELWKLSESLLLYIRRADPQWLEERLPARKQFTPHGSRVDWPKEDALLASAVKARISEILVSGVPTRISIRAITSHTGQLGRVRHRLDKLPQTAAILNSHVESTEKYLARRIAVVEESFRKEGVVPTKFAFAKRTQIRRYVSAGNEIVIRAMEEALLRLKSSITAD